MDSRFKYVFLIFILLFSINVFQPSLAIAAGDKVTEASESVTNVICRAIKIVQGPTGKTLAILVIISLAIGLFLGKITWGVAIAVAVGMGILFGANTVVGYISGVAGDPCGDVS